MQIYKIEFWPAFFKKGPLCDVFHGSGRTVSESSLYGEFDLRPSAGRAVNCMIVITQQTMAPTSSRAQVGYCGAPLYKVEACARDLARTLCRGNRSFRQG